MLERDVLPSRRCRGTPEQLAATYDGTSWSPAALPALVNSTTTNEFQGLSRPSSTFCVAVGTANPSGSPAPPAAGQSGQGGALIETYDGLDWSIAPAGELQDVGEFNSVSCPSPKFCVAVGDASTPAGQSRVRAYFSRVP